SLTTRPGTIAGYVLDAPIGEGATSTVWSAHRTDASDTPGERVAVKLLDLSRTGSKLEERFRREEQLLRRLVHPGIARLLDSGVNADGQLYLVLEYVGGDPIDAFAERQSLTIRGRVRLLRQVLAAVACAHANDIVHRDLKPSNILVTADGTAKVLDFGISKALDSAARGLRTLTSRGARVLTPDYAAPEQLRGDAVSPATDVYSLGVLLYMMVTGRHPTAAGVNSFTEAFAATLSRQPAPAGLGALDAILETALRKQAAERYADASAFGAALAEWL
ncbi:MAG TPA: serine/threonine-protein kinase, partial [Gemmatimonadaceae bacterium]|nr:serine/threonine-protein kinase [Gemmatimonadaceae bacterium]